MSFKYDLTANQQTPTSDSKVVLCKSFKIDIAAGAGFTTATTYDLGWLPKDAQAMLIQITTSTAVSGGTVSAATLGTSINGVATSSATNVFATGATTITPGSSYIPALPASTDQKVTYTSTLTGSGATAGVIYINIFYVV